MVVSINYIQTYLPVRQTPHSHCQRYILEIMAFSTKMDCDDIYLPFDLNACFWFFLRVAVSLICALSVKS